MREAAFEGARRQWRERHPGLDPGSFGPPPIFAVAVTDPPAVCFGEVGPARNGGTVDVTLAGLPECYLEGIDFWDTKASPPEFVTWKAVGHSVVLGESVTISCGPDVTGPVLRRLMSDGFPY